MITITELSDTDDYYQYCQLLEQLTTINPDSINRDDFIKFLSLIHSNPHHKIIIAKIHDQIVGTTTLLIEPKFIHDLSKVGHIEDVVVNKKYRSHGIGALLIRKAIEISKQFDCYKIILDCAERNCEFYSKFGFVKKELQMALYLD